MVHLPLIRNPQPHVEQRIHDALMQAREKGPVVRLSAIGHCTRKLWALHRELGEDEFSGRALAIFGTGDAVEDLVIRWLTLAGFSVRDRQLAVPMKLDDGQVILGHLDGVIELGGRFASELAVLEVKSAKAERFEQVQKVGYAVWSPEYYDQVQACMGAAGLQAALVVVFNKDTSELYCEKLRFDADAYEALRRRGTLVLTSERAPARPPQANGQFSGYCKYCPVSEWCYGPTVEVRFDD